MGRPFKEYRSEFFPAGANHVSPRPPVIEHWSNEYRETVVLLEERLINLIRMNPKLRKNIFNRRRFLINKTDGIYINLIEFNEGYRTKFILPDFEKYCTTFMEVFKDLLVDFLKEIGYAAYTFRFKFKLEGRLFEKSMNLFVEDESDGEN